ncbi:unnamed protein product [Peniophora sp. CBMAI 1063]|nr:unnamed protein product [Peniophora sp. CBMAI 1063]
MKSISRKGLREWADLENVLEIIEQYVTETADSLNRAPTGKAVGKTGSKGPSMTSEAYSIDELEDISAGPQASRLLIRKDRILGDLDKGKVVKHVLWQMVTCAHSKSESLSSLFVLRDIYILHLDCNTANPDLQPPWQALSIPEFASQLLHADCIPPAIEVRFGYNNSHTRSEHAKAFINHWTELGFLQFNKIWKNGKICDPLPAEERWHMLRPADGPDGSDEEERDQEGAQPDAQGVLQRKSPSYGSKGAILPVKITNPAGFEEPIRDTDLLDHEEPFDRVISWSSREPSAPCWHPPNVVPNASWCRGQYIQQAAREVGGLEMQTVLKAAVALTGCPLDDNYSLPLAVLDASASVPSAPLTARWDCPRAWLQSDLEVAALANFISRKPWTIRIKGGVVFSGYSQAWNVILATLVYARGRAHKDVLSNTPVPNWALSGQDVAHELAKGLTFSLPSRAIIETLQAFTEYLTEVSHRHQYPGVPLSLMYTRFDARMEYLRCLLNPVPELVDLMKVVQNMPPGSVDDRPRPCLPEMTVAIERSADIGSLWNWPRCGLPSPVHRRQDEQALIADIRSWWSSDELFFCEESGEVQTLENGLQHLLQAGLICQELAHLEEDREDSAGILRESCLQDEDLRDSIRNVLVTFARDHSTKLKTALTPVEDDEYEARSPAEADDAYDGEDVDFTLSVAELDARLRQETAGHDMYMRTIGKSLELDALDDARAAANQATRKQQNKDNRQRTGMIHPPKAHVDVTAGPDLAFVNDVTLPEVSPRDIVPKKKRVAKKTPRVRARPANQTLATVNHRQRAPEAAQKPAQKRKAPAKDVSSLQKKPPAKRRRTASLSAADAEEQESFDIHNISGDESEGLAPSATNEDGCRGENVTEPAPPKVTAKPRPRRVVPGNPGRPAAGVSTSFAETNVADSDLPKDASELVTGASRGRRSSLRSSNQESTPATVGPRTRSQSRTVHFAEAPPSASTRSKSRS